MFIIIKAMLKNKFWIDKDPKNNIVRFLQDNIDFTSTTLLYEEHVNGITEKEEFKSKTSNLQLRLEFRNGSVNLKRYFKTFDIYTDNR